jgi:very-short-patch-repair endonuclease
MLLRNRRMFDLKFHRQFPIANYVVDFYCDQLKLVLELDGEVHSDPEQAREDEIRNIHLQNLGYKVIRITNGRVLNEPAVFIEQIRRLLPSPGPSGHPLPVGEGPAHTSSFSPTSPSHKSSND